METNMTEMLDEMEQVFLACGDKTRLRLLNLIGIGEVGVTTLSDVLNISQPKVSRHLAYLRTMNVVNTRREGKSIYYSIAHPASPYAAALLHDILERLRSVPEMLEDSGKTPIQRNIDIIKHSNEDDISRSTYMNEEQPELEIYLL